MPPGGESPLCLDPALLQGEARTPAWELKVGCCFPFSSSWFDTCWLGSLLAQPHCSRGLWHNFGPLNLRSPLGGSEESCDFPAQAGRGWGQGTLCLPPGAHCDTHRCCSPSGHGEQRSEPPQCPGTLHFLSCKERTLLSVALQFIHKS